jgi:hypothetical protein
LLPAKFLERTPNVPRARRVCPARAGAEGEMVRIKRRGRVLVHLKDGTQPICDYIDYEGEPWFIPEYIKDANQKDTKKPARIISLSDYSNKRNPPHNVPANIEIVAELDLELFFTEGNHHYDHEYYRNRI